MLWGVLSVMVFTLAVAAGAILLSLDPAYAGVGIGVIGGGLVFGVLGAVLVHRDTRERAKGRSLPTVDVGKQSAVPEAANALGALFDAIR